MLKKKLLNWKRYIVVTVMKRIEIMNKTHFKRVDIFGEILNRESIASEHVTKLNEVSAERM